MAELKPRNVNYDEKFQQLIADLAAGRTLDQQVDACERTGNHGTPMVLRRGLLRNLGVPAPNPKAEIFMTFGCYVPFWSPFKLRDSAKLLSLLGIEYNWSDSEMCCGAPMMEDALEFVDSTDDLKNRMLAKGQQFMQGNCDLAKESGQKTMVYACQVCACLAKKAFPNEPGRHQWIYEPMLPKLEERNLSMPSPTVMGYFEGCHKFYPHNANLGWKMYRDFLAKVKGLELVDLPRTLCCKQDSEGILEDAAKRNLTTILAPDGDCHYMLKTAAQGSNTTVLNLSEVLLKVLGA